jgi:hypothetical protein
VNLKWQILRSVAAHVRRQSSPGCNFKSNPVAADGTPDVNSFIVCVVVDGAAGVLSKIEPTH